jgi:hypothetical protein
MEIPESVGRDIRADAKREREHSHGGETGS